MLNPFRRRQPPREPAREPAPAVEKKSAGLVALQQLHAAWTPGGYGSLAREGHARNPIVHACTRMIADAVSDCTVVASEDGVTVDDHPALALLGAPNEAMSGAELLEAVASHLLLSGDAYLRATVIDDEPRALHVLRPDRVRAVLDPDGWVQAYEYRTARHAERIAMGEGAPPLLHMRLFNPLDDHDGFPPLAAAAMALDVHNAAMRWNKALLDNSARPSGALVYDVADTNLTSEQFERLKSELEQGYAGAARAGRPLLLEGGLDWKAMSLSPRDMDFIEARNGAARDIALAFGVPPMLLGIPGDATYSNYAEAQRAFWRGTVLPLANRIVSALARFLSAHSGTRIALRVDVDAVSALSGEREAMWRRVSAADFLSRAEKRAALGLPAEEGP